ncbi:MAG: serine/threonine protein kinase, partial [Gemmatimonadales bacterium]
MSDPTMSGDDTWKASRNEGPGGRIGSFKILQQIGEGGYGDVFEAEQETPVKRRVALKVIKPGMDTRDVIARFEAERQALALMDHPHIARVLDAGATDSGRPYFVMELVKGEPMARYCDKHKLSVLERLKLFEQVCAAVQHAHTKGVIHRDLKPSNVLVSAQDDEPFAKVIDFGIAKATSGRLTDKTLLTELHQVLGTPLYMSPEQAEGSADIDTRTDIYSLGVMLYELLTGTTPVESTSLRSAVVAEIQRIICEVEPPRPSVRLSQAVTTLTGVATQRAMEPGKLTRMVRGELDWIVMKALEKDRTRRYQTANGLAMDVRRYLAGEPVLAAPPSTLYRARKFVRRHKGAVAAGSLIAAALVIGVAGFAWQAHIARARADELERVSAFQAAMLGQVDPTEAGKLLSDDVRIKFANALTEAGVPEAGRGAQ